MQCEICNEQLRWIGFTEDGQNLEIWQCWECNEIFILSDDGRLVSIESRAEIKEINKL